MTGHADSTDAARIEAAMLALLAERGPGKSICPSEVARAIGGPHPDGWGPLMQPVRRVAVRGPGGHPAQGAAGGPGRFPRRLQDRAGAAGLTSQRRGGGAGKSASVRPVTR